MRLCPMELSTGQNPIIEKNVMRGERPLKKLGVIAGMGPMATVTFLKKMALSLFLWDEPLLTSAQSPGSSFSSGAL